MSKSIPASCVSSVVTADGVPVAAAKILSKGLGASTGVLIIDGKEVWYLASSATDLDETLAGVNASLSKVATALQKITSTLVSIGEGMSGSSTAPPPTLAADVITLFGYVTELNAKVVELNTLKARLK